MTLEVIEEELPNIRAAWSWAIENKRVDEIKSSAFVLNSVYEDRGPEVGELFSKAVASLDETNPAHHAALGYTLLAQAGSLWHLTRNREAKECARRGLELLRPLGETHGIMVGLGMLGMFMWIFGDFARAKALFEEGLALSREHEHPGVHTRSRLLWDQAMLERELSEFPQVKRLFQEALAEVEQLDDLVTFANLKHEYGMYLVRHSFAKEGEKLVREGLRLMRELSHPKLECSILVNLALATYELGEVDQAEAILLEALALAEKLSMKDAKAKALARLGKIMMARGNYPEAQRYLRESLQLAWKWEHQFSILEALTFSSELSIAQAKGTTAAELLGMVRCQPAFLNEHGREVERLLVALSNQLSPEELEEALEWGKSMPLEEVVEGTLRQLLES